MFVIQMRYPDKWDWFSIWETTDGADCAEYLRSTVCNEFRNGVEYRMIYVKS